MSNTGSTDRPPRSAAEWVTFVVSCLILSGVVALIASQIGATDAPAAPTAELVGEPRQVDDGYEIDVELHNDGGATATDVQVVAELTIDGEVTDAEQLVDFLAADEAEPLVFRFPEDPGDGDLEVRVASYATP